MIATQQLTFQYPGEEKISFPDIELTTDALLIQGNSGCGKTTFLHLLSGLLSPTSGSIELLNTRFSDLPKSEKEKFRNQYLGISPQSPTFVASLRLREYFQLIQNQATTSAYFDLEKVLERWNLLSLIDKKPTALSGGEQQRFGLLAALLRKPKILFADEPTAALDKQNAFEVIEVLFELAAQYGIQLVIVSHDQRIAHRFSQKITL